jgi:putative membrane protein
MLSGSKIATLFFGVALLSTASLAGVGDSKVFLKKAAQDGMAEVRLAELALQMASNPDIQAFAKHMIEDHTAANDRLAQLAKDDKVTLHKEVTPKQKSAYEKLSKLNDRNRAFDRAYIAQAVRDHKKAIELFEKQAAHGTDAEVKAFAAETLPKLKMHLDMAAGLDTKLNTKSNMN